MNAYLAHLPSRKRPAGMLVDVIVRGPRRSIGVSG
jgi:hypothetical protein